MFEERFRGRRSGAVWHWYCERKTAVKTYCCQNVFVFSSAFRERANKINSDLFEGSVGFLELSCRSGVSFRNRFATAAL